MVRGLELRLVGAKARFGEALFSIPSPAGRGRPEGDQIRGGHPFFREGEGRLAASLAFGKHPRTSPLNKQPARQWPIAFFKCRFHRFGWLYSARIPIILID